MTPLLFKFNKEEDGEEGCVEVEVLVTGDVLAVLLDPEPEEEEGDEGEEVDDGEELLEGEL